MSPTDGLWEFGHTCTHTQTELLRWWNNRWRHNTIKTIVLHVRSFHAKPKSIFRSSLFMSGNMRLATSWQILDWTLSYSNILVKRIKFTYDCCVTFYSFCVRGRSFEKSYCTIDYEDINFWITSKFIVLLTLRSKNRSHVTDWYQRYFTIIIDVKMIDDKPVSDRPDKWEI